MTEQQKRVIEFALSKVGCGYIYGATGWICTPARRQQQAEQYKEYADKILGIGKKWDGKECYDCAQLVKQAVAAGGGILPSGANSQFNESPASWLGMGTIIPIDTRPDDSLVILYILDAKGKAQHTGVYVGGDDVVEAKGTAEGVVRTKLSKGNWTHWRKPLLGVTGVVDWSSQTYPCDAITRTKAGGGINLWGGPSNTGTKIKSVKEGAVVTVIERPVASGFAVSSYDGSTGYADTQYLYPVDMGMEEKSVEPTGTPEVQENALIGSNTFELKPVRFKAYPVIGSMTIQTPNGAVTANDGDYIVKEMPGGPYVIKPEVFLALCFWVSPSGELREI